MPHESFSSPALRLNNDVMLSAYFQSMLAYFANNEQPAPSLLRLKLKELIASILLGRTNPTLAAYLRSLAGTAVISLSGIMESNFRYNLSLEEFAELCNRSLSSFKRDFQEVYHEAPGKWLLKRRLEYAATLLRRGELNVSQVAFESGFEDLSHFSKTFKDRFGVSPASYRTKALIEP
jgi:AraC-like DNA-binding protein